MRWLSEPDSSLGLPAFILPDSGQRIQFHSGVTVMTEESPHFIVLAPHQNHFNLSGSKTISIHTCWSIAKVVNGTLLPRARHFRYIKIIDCLLNPVLKHAEIIPVFVCNRTSGLTDQF